jgi:two-component system KDP operon response regulator KdpE
MVKGCPLILVIEEERALRKYLRATLHSNGYRMEEAVTGPEGSALAAQLSPELVILDLDLPGQDGLDLARELRERSFVPIIALSERDSEADKVRALDQGADDFLAKPFGSAELLARIRVALRRAAHEAVSPAGSSLEIGILKLDLLNREVTLAGVDVHLTPNEFKILVLLARHAGKVVTHQQLLAAIGGARPPTEPGLLLRVHLARLRKKLEADPSRPNLLTTKPGRGYRLNRPDLVPVERAAK